MNKKLVALAVGSALGLAPLAAPQAKVTVYGHAQVEVANYDDGTNDGIVVSDQARGRLGVKAKEKLGNGMTAIAQFEWRINTEKGGTPAGSREAYVGLKGSFGTIQLGNLKSAYKYSGGVKYDPFVTTFLEARGTGGMSQDELGHKAFGHSAFLSDSIGWKSNNFSGLTIWVTYSPDEGVAGNAGGTGADGDYSLAINYKNGPLELGVSMVNNDDTTGGDATKFYGKYKFGSMTLLGQYESLEGNSANANLGANAEADIWFVGFHFKSGNNLFVAQAGNKEVDGATNDTDYFAIGIIHHLSKKTRLFGGYRNTDDGTANGETDVFSVGLRMVF
jgi:predicted porin